MWTTSGEASGVSAVRAPPRRWVDLAQQLGDLGLDIGIEVSTDVARLSGQGLLQRRGVLTGVVVCEGLVANCFRNHAAGVVVHLLLDLIVIDEVGELDAEPLDGPHQVVGVGRRDGGPPLHGQVLLALLLEKVGVGGGDAQSHRIGSGQRRGHRTAAELRLEHQPGGRDLTQVTPRAGLDQPELHGLLGVGRSREGFGDEPQRDFGAPQGALAVGQDGPVTGVAAHAPVGTDLARRLGEVTGVVRRDADGLADRRHAGGTVAGCAGMGQCRLRVLVHQRAGRDEVPGHALGVARVQPPQRVTDGAVEFSGVGPLGQFGPGRKGRTAVLAVGKTTVSAGRTGAAPVVRGPTLTPVPRRSATRTPRASAMRVVPLGAVTLRTVVPSPVALGSGGVRGLAGGTSVLPGMSIALRTATLRTATLRPLTRRPTVLPLRTLAVRTVPLRSPLLPPRRRTSGSLRPVASSAAGRGPSVLPLRTLRSRPVVTRPVGRGTAGLPAGATLTGNPLGPVTLGTSTLGTVPLRTAVLPAGAVPTVTAIAGRASGPLRAVPAGPPVLPTAAVPAVTAIAGRASGPLRAVTAGPPVLPSGAVDRRPPLSAGCVTLRAAVLPLRAIPCASVPAGAVTRGAGRSATGARRPGRPVARAAAALPRRLLAP